MSLIPTDETKQPRSFAVFTLHAHPKLYSNAVITGWGEAACLWYEGVLFSL